MEERMNCIQITLTSDKLWDVWNKDDDKTFMVLHETSNFPMIQNTIEKSKAKYYQSISELIIQEIVNKFNQH